ncbi:MULTISPECIES: LysR substrate-binding domain-containing protein [unclassified Roseitalea]|uniref:LysR substrate-binding domain-containing protein n=1 Tax=unclassified Roseitalea TaxID=2639107 RepID=UPI00273DCD80|nr:MULTISPECIES: LysR substrate-binding domain-containing protein [unclassified Roseitalea]
MKRSMLPLNALRAFEATMRLGQMKLAADELGVTYGAVSRQVRALEDRLGVSLFEGPRNKLVPTKAAQDLQPGLQDAFDRLERAIDQMLRREQRQLDLSCLSTLAMRWLIPILFDFQSRHPDIEVRMTADDAPVDFARQRFDVAIRVGSGPWGQSMVTPLFKEEIGPVVSPRLASHPKVSSWQDIASIPRIHTRTRISAWPDWFVRNGLTPMGGGQEFEHFYFMLEAATVGLGMAIAPRVLVEDDLEAGRLIAPLGFQPSGHEYVALTSKHPTQEALTFVNWLSQHLSHRRSVDNNEN